MRITQDIPLGCNLLIERLVVSFYTNGVIASHQMMILAIIIILSYH
jgi:hypothetical protein